jgi:hypothetical protein
MNRIQELVDQAKKSVPAGLDPARWLEVYHEKFAELIIKEYTNVLKDSLANYDTRAMFHPQEIVEHATRLINRHFGVEE